MPPCRADPRLLTAAEIPVTIALANRPSVFAWVMPADTATQSHKIDGLHRRLAEAVAKIDSGEGTYRQRGSACLRQKGRRYTQFHRRQSRYQLSRSAAQRGEDNETG